MSVTHLLEDFGTSFSGSPGSAAGPDIEARKLESYENGYKAGWQDALKSREDDADRITGDFARNLQDLSFTYHEAHAQVMQAMGPLLQEIVDTVLPETIRESIGVRVIDQLTEMARDHGTQRVEIACAAADFDKINAMLAGDFGFPVAAVADDTLAQGQVFLRMAQEERQIDMESVLAGIRGAVAGVLEENERVLKHG